MSHIMQLHPSTISKKIGLDLILEQAKSRSYTPYGRERLDKQKPSGDTGEIKHLNELASNWMEILQREGNQPLFRVKDVRPILDDSYADGSMLPLDAFDIVYDNARLARIIKQFFKNDEIQAPAVDKYVKQLLTLKSLEDEIRRVISENGVMRDDASPKLRSIRTKINRRKSQLRKTINRVMKIAREKGMSSDEGPTIRNGRMVIPIQAEYKRKVDGFVHDLSSSGQTVYVEPVEALQINNDIREFESEEKREIERIIRDLTTSVRQSSDALRANIRYIGQLDALHSKVELGLKLDGAIPQLSDDGELNLISARNPNLVLKNSLTEESEPIVPLNLSLESNELGLIITGPNAGGKSVAMKTAGLLTCMHQMGYPIPVQPDSTLPVCSGLFVDVGDDQSIENDLSTFSSRLQWMRHTLDHAKEGALILIDEAGTGTDPDEGGALFQAFIERMIENGARVIGTTHHGSLKVFAHEHPNLINGAMEFDQSTLSPTYRFRKGVPGSSYAFEIADRMNLHKNVMKRARELLGDQKNRMGEMLLSLEKQIQENQSEHDELRNLKIEAEIRDEKLSKKQQEFDREKKKILNDAYKEADRIMQTANQRIEAAVEKIIAAGNEDRETIREARREIQDTKKAVRRGKADLEISMESSKSSKIPEVGDYVTVGEGGTSGEVVEISGKQVTILVNGMKIKSKLNKITPASPPKKKKKQSTRSYGGSDKIDLNVKPRLDIRGYRGDAAVKELMHYIDNAVARGMQQVEIVHGKGDGILKKLVHEHLEKRKEIKKYNLAPWEQGGPGCTLVELK
ncbi:endonuclease MutS2 [Rhodohalobacter sp. SW132]|uniref:endonuclease MutS2 n=1 Tax=Rhodohalobacter sp. SW132 TaxID=2293433 RepID=UPI000E25C597|nr:endonuclease MutS2 [Rhodohalobacter sp. SW132]